MLIYLVAQNSTSNKTLTMASPSTQQDSSERTCPPTVRVRRHQVESPDPVEQMQEELYDMPAQDAAVAAVRMIYAIDQTASKRIMDDDLQALFRAFPQLGAAQTDCLRAQVPLLSVRFILKLIQAVVQLAVQALPETSGEEQLELFRSMWDRIKAQ